MKKDLIKIIAFFLVMLIYIGVPSQMIYSYQSTLRNGNVYRFQPAPVDPYDAARGKYVTLSYMLGGMDYDTSKASFKDGDDVYLKLGKDSSGFATITEVLEEAPEKEDYIKTMVNWAYIDSVGHVSFNLPFNRYYLPEEMAQEAETAYRENLVWGQDWQGDSSVYVDVRVKNGTAVIEELYFEGLPVKEYIHKRAKGKK
jgi:uncharacterized membrane-anchored protein